MSKKSIFLGMDVDRTTERLNSYHPGVNEAFYNSIDWLFSQYLDQFVTEFITHGGENVPAKGTNLIIPNHVSHFDHPILGTGLLQAKGRATRFVGKSEFTSGPFGQIVGRGMERGGYGPVDRSSGQGLSGQHVIQAMFDVIDARGQLVAGYAEGGRKGSAKKKGESDYQPITGETLKKGLPKQALLRKWPILPVGIVGARHWDVMVVAFAEPMPPLTIDDPENQVALDALVMEHTHQLGINMTQIRDVARDLREERMEQLGIQPRPMPELKAILNPKHLLSLVAA